MSFLKPDLPKPPPPPPSTPTRADASVLEAGQRSANYSNFVATGSASGLARKARTVKPSLIGG